MCSNHWRWYFVEKSQGTRIIGSIVVTSLLEYYWVKDTLYTEPESFALYCLLSVQTQLFWTCFAMQLSMRMMFTPKHQKLVNQCYPTGRTTDKKPKSSETSYLLYYVNSRRSKLEKVSTYLIKRSTSDLNHRRIGNIAVTLDLMNKIVLHCKENLNVFVKDFITIVSLLKFIV